MARVQSVYCDTRPWDTSCEIPDPVMTVVGGGGGINVVSGGGYSEKQDILDQLAEINAALAARQIGDAGLALRNVWIPMRKVKAFIKKLNRRLAQIAKLEARGLMGLSGLGATRLVRRPQPAVKPAPVEDTKTRNMLIGVGALAVLGSVAFYIFNKKG